jgi:beta-1,4-mannosyltransferase
MFWFVVGGILIALYFCRTQQCEERAIIAVLGDIGRSPRMQNHACSLIQHNLKVDFLGYRGSKPIDFLQHTDKVAFHFIDQPKKLSVGKLGYLIGGIARVLSQTCSVIYLLLILRKPRFMIIQNPPAIPTLFIFQFISIVRGIPLVIDWHNFGFTIMQVSGVSRKIVQLAESYERWAGKAARLHITVTKAMKEELNRWPVYGNVSVLYDRPPSFFKPLSNLEKQEFLNSIDFSNVELEKRECGSNPFVESNKLSQNRPAVLISSTSWTEDEDFSILLDALVLYETKYHPGLPKLCAIITGKGPKKDFYLKIVENLELKNVMIHTYWLEPEDYPTMLGCADIGISLHTSSSGLDLPMKVVDMFGVGLPVLALDFPWYENLTQPRRIGSR